MKKLFFLLLIILKSVATYSQITIQMKKQGGVSVIPCKVNGLNLSFIFDTGASDVSISLTEASFMLKNGYLDKSDIIGTSNYLDANGEISEGIVINLREIEVQGLKLENIRASIVKKMDAPLLLGQSAISKLGKFQIDLVSNTLTINTGETNFKIEQKNDILVAENELDIVKKIELFERLCIKYQASFEIAYNTSVYMFKFIASHVPSEYKTKEYKEKLPEILKKAISLKSTIDGNMMMASFYYNNSIDISNDARSTYNNSDKAFLESNAGFQMNFSIPYAESVIELFEAKAKPSVSDINAYKGSIMMLKNIYKIKGENAKSRAYAKKEKAIE